MDENAHGRFPLRFIRFASAETRQLQRIGALTRRRQQGREQTYCNLDPIRLNFPSNLPTY